MNYKVMAFCMASLLTHCLATGNPLTVTVNSLNASQKAPLIILAVNPQLQTEEVIKRVAHNLACSNQKLAGFAIDTQIIDRLPSKQLFSKLGTKGFSLVLLITNKNNGIEWRLYDSATLTLYASKKIMIKNENAPDLPSHLGNLIADEIWALLTGQESFFCTKIVYCCQTKDNKKNQKSLCVVSPQDIDAQILIKNSKILAPRWHPNSHQKLIFYSAITPANVSLNAIDLKGTIYPISNFNGITMLPSFCLDGSKMLYCLTDQGGTNIYKCEQANPLASRQKMPLLKGNNISPILLESDDIIFCSDSRGKPHIYYYEAATQKIEPIATDSYCSSPAWCSASQTLAYCKLIKGVMQVVLYDFKTKKHTQLTFSDGDKDDCSWSPEGNYLAFSKNGRIMIFNLTTREEFFLTAKNKVCTYPAWSPNFKII